MTEIVHPHEGFTAIVIDTAALTADEALESGIEEIVRALTAAAHERRERVAIDVRVDAPDDSGVKEALVEAVRGLAQGYVAESGNRIPPVNVVVSHESQGPDRETTWRFLSDPDGGLARGSTFDLRAERP